MALFIKNEWKDKLILQTDLSSISIPVDSILRGSHPASQGLVGMTNCDTVSKLRILIPFRYRSILPIFDPTLDRDLGWMELRSVRTHGRGRGSAQSNEALIAGDKS